MFDSDGEFLLIEAAEALPAWVTPTNAENRVRMHLVFFTVTGLVTLDFQVWIYASHLHLIPLSHISAPSSKRRRRRYPGTGDSDNEDDAVDSEHYLDVKDALRVLLNDEVETEAPPAVESSVWQRISG